jgi:hypothetical protein
MFIFGFVVGASVVLFVPKVFEYGVYVKEAALALLAKLK